MTCTSAVAQYARDGCAHASSLPFTGFGLVGVLLVSASLIVLGAALIWTADRKSRR